jgi:hypothetical protein
LKWGYRANAKLKLIGRPIFVAVATKVYINLISCLAVTIDAIEVEIGIVTNLDR